MYSTGKFHMGKGKEFFFSGSYFSCLDGLSVAPSCFALHCHCSSRRALHKIAKNPTFSTWDDFFLKVRKRVIKIKRFYRPM